MIPALHLPLNFTRQADRLVQTKSAGRHDHSKAPYTGVDYYDHRDDHCRPIHASFPSSVLFRRQSRSPTCCAQPARVRPSEFKRLLGHFPHCRPVVVTALSFRELHIGTTPVSPFMFISIDEWNQFPRSLPIRPEGISELLGKQFLLHPDSVEKDRDQ